MGGKAVHVITLNGRQGPQGRLGELNTHSRNPPKHTGEFKEHRDRARVGGQQREKKRSLLVSRVWAGFSRFLASYSRN